MRIRIVTPERGAMTACDECGFWPKMLVEVQFSRSPMVAKLCPSCAGKLAEETKDILPWAGQGGKRIAVGE